MNKQTLIAAAAGLALTATVQAQQARDYVSIVGSSTVYPFSTVVAEQFGKTSAFKTPKIESTGSGGGLKLFCSGVGVQHPDITNSSRRIKQSEVDNCANNGVTEIIEIKVGYDGIAFANSKKAPQMTISRKEMFLALAAEVPGPNGTFVKNPAMTWADINPSLPKTKIEVLGPPPTSGTRDAFVELVMDEGCNEIAEIKALKGDQARHKALCQTVREDGAFIEAGENDNLIVQKLVANADAFGIFGYSFLDQNGDKLQGAKIDGVEATFDNIASGDYPVSRPLYFYVKKAHIGVIPGIEEYVAEFTSDKAWGDDGYLTEKGMIPMPREERTKFADDARAKNTLAAL